jgi:hypothetical protein
MTEDLRSRPESLDSPVIPALLGGVFAVLGLALLMSLVVAGVLLLVAEHFGLTTW